ncbi:MAG: hypothetical protein OEY86_15995 [Nitrospira sp.]|nr:hypothetical protein [Nitrospira sp.]
MRTSPVIGGGQEIAKDACRILSDGRVAAVLTHGLVKEREVPTKDIQRALERKRRFERDPQAHTYREE